MDRAGSKDAVQRTGSDRLWNKKLRIHDLINVDLNAPMIFILVVEWVR